MVDEITQKSGEIGVVLRENDENGVVLRIFGDFGCRLGVFLWPRRGQL
jgi:hypothetical protein